MSNIHHLNTIELFNGLLLEKSNDCTIDKLLEKYSYEVVPKGSKPSIRKIRKRVIDICRRLLRTNQSSELTQKEIILDQKIAQFQALIQSLKTYRDWLNGNEDITKHKAIWNTLKEELEKWEKLDES